MKKTEKIILESCAFAMLLIGAFFLISWIGMPDITPAIEIGKFFLILIFSFVINIARLLFGVKRLPKLAALSIHYAIALLAFSLIFVSPEQLVGARIFILWVSFTIFYAILFAASVGIKHLANKIDTAAEKKGAKKEPAEYKSRYK